MQVRQKWKTEQPTLQVGDICLISEDKTPRNAWPMGRVSKVFKGKDGLVRTVQLKTATTYLTRPVQRLHLYERGVNMNNEQLATNEIMVNTDNEMNTVEIMDSAPNNSSEDEVKQDTANGISNLNTQGYAQQQKYTYRGRAIKTPKRFIE